MPVLTKVYHADGVAQAMDFSFHAGLRNHTDGFHCPDEAVDCPTTTYIVCSFDALKSVEHTLGFLECMDGEKSDDPETKAKDCAAQLKIDFSVVASCFSGSRGKQLMQDAADFINTNYPLSGPQLYVPHIKVGGNTLSNQTHTPDYKEVLAAVCATGIKAAACNSQKFSV